MLKAIKEALIDYVLLGFVFGVLSVVWAREPLSTADKIKKVVASVTIALIVGGACRGFELNYYFSVAIIGGCCSFAREIFDTAAHLLQILADKPLQTIKSLVDIFRGGGNDKS